MADTGISHLRDAYPPTLRRGEKQRVAIASALAMKSKILILDEPTSGQDGKETRELLELLETLRATGLTIILVTHDMEIMASHCTRAIIVGYGTKAFDGKPEELFTSRDDLFDLGLTKPPCVELAETVPGLVIANQWQNLKQKCWLKGSQLGGTMQRLVPFTKILMTIAFSAWAVLLTTTYELSLLLALELLILLVTGLLIRQYKAVLTLAAFAVFLAVVQFLGGGTLESAYVTGLRMLCMTMVFIMLLATTKLQDLTAALVTQCKIPYEYAFMFTAAFVSYRISLRKAMPFRKLRLVEVLLWKVISSNALLLTVLSFNHCC